MAIHYFCRHCKTHVGMVEDEGEVDEHKLGLAMLTDEEKQSFIQYASDGNKHVQVICEHCEEALRQNPSLHAVDRWIH